MSIINKLWINVLIRRNILVFRLNNDRIQSLSNRRNLKMLSSRRVFTQIRILKRQVVSLFLLFHRRPRFCYLLTHKSHLFTNFRSTFSFDHKFIFSQIDAVFLSWAVPKQLVESFSYETWLPIFNLNDSIYLLFKFLLRSRSQVKFFTDLLDTKRIKHILCKQILLFSEHL